MNTIHHRVQRLRSRIDELAAISEEAGVITRRYGTVAWRAGAEKVLRWMEEAGLEARIDAIGNVRGRLRGDVIDGGEVRSGVKGSRRVLVIGSHIDTVRNAGRWDGPLGVLMGLDLLEEAIKEKRDFPFDIEVIAFCDEEGVRYHSTYLGSQVAAGRFDPSYLQRKDEEGISLEEAILAWGGDPADLKDEAIPAEGWLGYFEIHIEQGPILYERKIPVAVVRAIAGQMREEVIFRGVAGHAGTVPMDRRRDALCAAAEWILEVEKFAVAAGKELVATVGKLQIPQAASNVIPGEVVCSLDLRSAEEAVLWRAYEQIGALSEAIGRRRGIRIERKRVQTSLPVICDRRMSSLLGEVIRDAGYEELCLMSGAGHDGVMIAAVAPVAMLFVRCYQGISHHPLEDVAEGDLMAAIPICDKFIQQLTEIWRYPP